MKTRLKECLLFVSFVAACGGREDGAQQRSPVGGNYGAGAAGRSSSASASATSGSLSTVGASSSTGIGATGTTTSQSDPLHAGGAALLVAGGAPSSSTLGVAGTIASGGTRGIAGSSTAASLGGVTSSGGRSSASNTLANGGTSATANVGGFTLGRTGGTSSTAGRAGGTVSGGSGNPGAGGTTGQRGGSASVAGAPLGGAAGQTGVGDCPADMILVGAGDFLMGSVATDPDAIGNELPQHTVTLRAYCVDKFETTNSEYQACVAAGQCSVPNTVSPDSGYSDPKRGMHPAVGLTWQQANSYCRWTGKRLPTEAEWEKAARGPAPDSRLHPWGNQQLDPSMLITCPQNSDVNVSTADISPYGTVSMASGAPEWVADLYDADYYATSPTENPTGPLSGTDYVVRGTPCSPCLVAVVPGRVSMRLNCSSTPTAAVGVRCASDPLP